MKTPKTATVRQFLSIGVAVWMVAAQCLAITGAPELPNPGQPRMTRDQQKQMGLKVAGQVYAQMPVLPDSSPETKYIQDVGRRLFTVIPADRSWPFQFHVVAQKEINAFALPGGVMFVNVGTITAVDNEAELAGVMAHEMAHVYMQHSAKQQDKGSLLGGLAGIAGAIAGSMGGTLGTLAQAGIQVGAGTLMMKYSRGDEAQADEVGAIILWKAVYNPEALADFFQKMESKGGSGPQFLSDHPNPGNRKAAIQNEVRAWPARKYSADSAEFVGVRRHASSLKAYDTQEIAAGAKSDQWAKENRQNGALLPDAPTADQAAQPTRPPTQPVSMATVQPSSNFQNANLGILRIDHPQNWTVAAQDQSSAIIAPAAGLAGSAVGYGAVVRTGRAPSANMGANQLSAAFVQNLKSSDPNMRQIGSLQSISVNGIAASSVKLETVSPIAAPDGKQQRERDWLITIPRGSQDAAFIIFISPLAEFEQFRPTFERMLRSVRF